MLITNHLRPYPNPNLDFTVPLKDYPPPFVSATLFRARVHLRKYSVQLSGWQDARRWFEIRQELEGRGDNYLHYHW